MENLGLPYRIQTLLNTMIKSYETRAHLLLIGPPGSGKTTSARFFVEALHGRGATATFFGRALFLNSSDERGLEAVRSRVYPFVRSSFSALFSATTAPKVIVFDEAETLTDQAQIALRPLLDESPSKVLIIFLCNSISRIHQSIIHKFLVIPFEAPNNQDFKHRMDIILKNPYNTDVLESSRAAALGNNFAINKPTSKVKTTENLISGLDIEFRRGDIRFFILNSTKYNDCAKLWTTLLTTHITSIDSVFELTLQKWTYPDLAMFCIFCANATNTFTRDALIEMLSITDTDFIKMVGLKQRSYLISKWFKHFVREKLETFPPVSPPKC